MIAGDDAPLPGERQDAPEPRAPALPIEGSIVGAALEIRDVGLKAELLLWLLRNNPRDHDNIAKLFQEMDGKLRESWRHYAAYHDIRHCQGQA